MEFRRVKGVRVISRGLTHALRNIAEVISNFNGAVLRDRSDSNKVKEYSREISTEVGKMTTLFDALARHAAINIKDLHTRIHQVITDLVTLQSRRFHDHNIILRSSLDPICDPVRKDQDKFLVILLSVLENSFAALQGKKDMQEVTVRTRYSRDPERVIITVADTGDGIAKEKLGRIFEWPAVDLGGSPPIHKVGLPIAQSLVQSMGGDIRIKSQAGGGTTVVVGLPLEEVHNDE